MENLMGLDGWMIEILQEKLFMEPLLKGLNQKQLISLFKELDMDGKDLKNQHKNFLRSKLLLKNLRGKLVSQKISPPYSQLTNKGIETMASGELLEELELLPLTYLEISLIMILQNHYTESLKYYYYHFQENDMKKFPLESLRKYQLENYVLREENQMLNDQVNVEYNKSTSLIDVYKSKTSGLEKEIDVYVQKIEKYKKEIADLELSIENNKEFISSSIDRSLDLKAITSDIVKHLPGSLVDISESLELVSGALDQAIASIEKKISQSLRNRTFSIPTNFYQLAESIHYYEKQVNDVIHYLDLENIERNEVLVEREIPNYEGYQVDCEIEYTLYENFTHKRPHSFKINEGERIEATTWKAVLVKTCEILYVDNPEKFKSFQSSAKMNGRRNKYFTIQEEGLWSPKKIGDMFIESAINANGIRNLIIKMLQEYNYSIHEYKVYLRADYTDLHKIDPV